MHIKNEEIFINKSVTIVMVLRQKQKKNSFLNKSK